MLLDKQLINSKKNQYHHNISLRATFQHIHNIPLLIQYRHLHKVVLRQEKGLIK